MQKLLFITIICLGLVSLMIGCGPADDQIAPKNLTNETNNESSTNIFTPEKPVEKPATTNNDEKGGEDIRALTPASAENLPPPPSSDIETFDLDLASITIYKEAYGAKETHELGLLLASDKLSRIKEVELQFTPECYEDLDMLVILNDHLVYDGELPCLQKSSLALDPELFQESKNVITISSQVTKPCKIADITLIFTYKDGTIEPLASDDFFFMASEDEEETFRQLGETKLTNKEVKTFSLKSEHLNQDLYLEFAAPNKEGILTILFNGYEVYSDEVGNDGLRVTLPRQFLLEGKNELIFIGQPES